MRARSPAKPRNSVIARVGVTVHEAGQQHAVAARRGARRRARRSRRRRSRRSCPSTARSDTGAPDGRRAPMTARLIGRASGSSRSRLALQPRRGVRGHAVLVRLDGERRTADAVREVVDDAHAGVVDVELVRGHALGRHRHTDQVGVPRREADLGAGLETGAVRLPVHAAVDDRLACDVAPRVEERGPPSGREPGDNVLAGGVRDDRGLRRGRGSRRGSRSCRPPGPRGATRPS